MKTKYFGTLTVLLMSMLLVSCGNSSKSSSVQEVVPVDSVRAFHEDAKAKNLLFSDMVKTDYIKNYIVKNYSEKFYNAILSNLRSDYVPSMEEDLMGDTTYVYSNGSTDDNILLKLDFRVGKSPERSVIYAEINKLGCRVNRDGSLRTGSWEKEYLVDDFNEEMLEYPLIQTTLTYDNGYKNENLYVSFCKNGNRLEFRLAGDITDYGSLKDYRILIKQNENSTKEIQIDERFGKCLVVYNDQGMHDLLNYFNEYDYGKKMVITYDDDWTEIYKKAIITNNGPGEDIFGAIYSFIYNRDINSL